MLYVYDYLFYCALHCLQHMRLSVFILLSYRSTFIAACIVSDTRASSSSTLPLVDTTDGVQVTSRGMTDLDEEALRQRIDALELKWRAEQLRADGAERELAMCVCRQFHP